MTLDLSFESIMSCVTVISLLVIYSILDIRDRKVKNEVVLVGLAVGVVILTITGHFVNYLELHLTALSLVVPLAYVLFTIGSIGGADVKILFVVNLVSPGIELGIWNQPLLESIIGLGGELITMLLGGYLYWRFRKSGENATPPLIPFLLVGYLLIQLIAIF